MLNFSVKSLLAAVLLITSVHGHAAYIDFEDSPFADSQTYESVVYDLGGGKTLTITAFILDANDGSGNIFSRTQITDPFGVYQGSGGLGVESSADDGNHLDGTSDGDPVGDVDEGLLFSFNFVTELVHINFGSWDSDEDDFNLEVDGRNLMHDVWDGNSLDFMQFIDFADDDHFFFNNVIGNQFLIWADGASDNFRIDGITISEVPAPYGLGLLSISLLLLWQFRQRND